MPENQKKITKSLLVVILSAIALFGTGCATLQANINPNSVQQGGSVQANGITIAYESFGPTNREPILMIAGTGQQLIDWTPELIQELVRRGYRVIVYDNRDAGLSTKFDTAGLPDAAAITQALQQGKPPPFPYTLRDMANDAVALLDALGIKQAHIVGASMGGAIAQLVAIEHPEHVLSLTLLSTNSGDPAIPALAKPAAFAAVPPFPAADDKAGFLEYLVQTEKALTSPGYPADDKTLRAAVQADVNRSYDPGAFVRQQTVSLLGLYDGNYRHDHLKTIKVPTVIVQGQDDPLVSVDNAHELAALIPGSKLRLIPGLGHDIPVQLVPTFADAITSAATRA